MDLIISSRMKRSVLIAFVACFVAVFQSAAQCLPVKMGKDMAFQSGEELKYTLHYVWGPINADVASGTFSLTDAMSGGKNVLLARIYGKNAKFYDPVFKMREDYRSWILPDGFLPVRFTRDTKEGNWFATNDYSFMYDASPAHIHADLDSKSKGKRQISLPLKECTRDVVSLFYYARCVDTDKLVQGKKYPMTFAVDDDICNIFFIFQGRETINVKGIGQVKTLRIRIKLAQGEVFGDDVEAAGDAWFTDDGNKLLVYFESPIKVGKIKGRLASYSGLKHEFSSLVK